MTSILEKIKGLLGKGKAKLPPTDKQSDKETTKGGATAAPSRAADKVPAPENRPSQQTKKTETRKRQSKSKKKAE